MSTSSIQSYLRNASSYAQQSYYNSTSKNRSSSTTNISNAAKGSALALTQNPLRYSSYSVNTAPRGSTVFEITDNTAGRIKNGAPVGKPAFRVDGPHGKVTYNHINTNPKLYTNNFIVKALDHTPISNTVYTAAKNFETIGQAAKVGGRALGVAAVALDAYDIYQAYKANGNKIGKNTVTTVSGVAGSWGGAIAGAEAGAWGGAAIGSIILPGIGTAIGGFLGGLVGGITGSIAGRAAGQELAKAVYR